MFQNLRIKERLKRSFIMVSAIATVAAVIGAIALIVVTISYSYALTNYGFSQGDIGRAMIAFADARGSMRAIIGYQDADVIAKELENHSEKKTRFEGYWELVDDTMTTEEEFAEYDRISVLLDEYWKIEEEVMAIGNTTDDELSKQAQQMAAEELDPIYDDVYDTLLDLLVTNINQGHSLSDTLSIGSYILIAAIIIIIIATLIIATRMGNTIANGIAAPLSALSERLGTFATGDLSSPFPAIESEDEVADMIQEANSMAEKLSFIIDDAGRLLEQMANGNYIIKSDDVSKYTGDFEKLLLSMRGMRDQMIVTLQSIGEASSQVSAGASNLAEASQSLAEGATDQAGAVEELQATITNITDSIKAAAKEAEDSYDQARRYSDEAEQSRSDMDSMVASMEKINETSKKIGDIISEIEDIADQTNLLSLNASIEAARAGEAGRGFAVVADQIRQLAEQSGEAAVNTRALIEGSLQEIAEGNKAAEHAAASIEHVVDGIEQIAKTSQHISAVSADQAIAMEQAEEGVTQIAEVVQSNSATAQEASATSEELSAQAINLDELISKFQIPV